jgi:hypothetical protein
MGDQHIAAFEHRARVSERDTLGLAICTGNCRSGWSGNKGDESG